MPLNIIHQPLNYKARANRLIKWARTLYYQRDYEASNVCLLEAIMCYQQLNRYDLVEMLVTMVYNNYINQDLKDKVL